MEIKAKNHTVPLKAAKYYLKSMYGISMNDEDFVENAMLILRTEIGTYEKLNKKIIEIIVPDNLMVELPEPAETLVSVKTTDTKINRYGETVQANDRGGLTTYDIRRTHNPFNLENNKNFTESEFITDNYYVNYEWVNDMTIRITDDMMNGQTLEIVYANQTNGTDNLPEVNLKQAHAIAARIAYMESMKKTFMGDVAAGQLLAIIGPESARLISAARIPETLSNNELDKMADINMSHNRKRFGVPLKLGR